MQFPPEKFETFAWDNVNHILYRVKYFIANAMGVINRVEICDFPGVMELHRFTYFHHNLN